MSIEMATAATAQFGRAIAGYWYMSSPVTIAIAALGIIYLWITTEANRYKRKGLRLWLYRCNWGRGALPEWQSGNGQAQQMRVLLETLQRPSVWGKAFYIGGERGPRKHLGFWVQIELPALLAGNEVTLQPAVIDRRSYDDDRLLSADRFFYEHFQKGHWVDPKRVGQFPYGAGSSAADVDFSYSRSDQRRLWQVWIETAVQDPVLELEIKYPEGVLQHAGPRGYIFRLALSATPAEADRANTDLSGQLIEPDGIVLHTKKTKLLQLIVPK